MVAVGPITQATDEEMAVALGTVSVLNSVALFIFPAIGAALKLSQSQFGLWAALAIHDTSSVVGAAAKCRTEALADVDHGEASPRPVDCSFDRWDGRGARREGENSVALVYRSFLPGSGIEYVSAGGAHAYAIAVKVAKIGLTATLFLIGSGISLETVKRVGHRPLLQGILLCCWGWPDRRG
jgi:uncharacterized membrane protein YadS